MSKVAGEAGCYVTGFILAALKNQTGVEYERWLKTIVPIVMKKYFLGFVILLVIAPCMAADNTYTWLQGSEGGEPVAERFQPPAGFFRPDARQGSFANWLRNLPLKPVGTPVLLYNGKLKPQQDVHVAVIDMDAGRRDLQQCADAVMRLRAEYLFSKKRFQDVHFNFTNGDKASWSSWASGIRPMVNGNKVRWVKKATADASYRSFRNYLDTVFTYAGTHSLSKELRTKKEINALEVGDVFIKGGFPGHAVLVMDVVEHASNGEKLFLLAQSYMPAQDMHILNNTMEPELSPWYRIPEGSDLRTPEWTFQKTQLKAFRQSDLLTAKILN